MFVHYYTHVPLNISEVEKRLDRVKNRLGDMADVAYREGEQLRSKVSPWVEGFAKEVEMEIGTAEIHRTGIAYPMKWTATGAEVLFPQLNADLLLAHVGQDMTRISVQGTYKPPLGVVGRIADRVILGRFAEATIRNWVDRLAEALMDESLFTNEAGE
ncbi:MAG TPA: hypothetical protein EYP73_06860 [Acidimicrobiia bacterium]|nr:hypothetical protein [Acidimicrobiia bacterium]